MLAHAVTVSITISGKSGLARCPLILFLDHLFEREPLGIIGAGSLLARCLSVTQPALLNH